MASHICTLSIYRPVIMLCAQQGILHNNLRYNLRRFPLQGAEGALFLFTFAQIVFINDH